MISEIFISFITSIVLIFSFKLGIDFYVLLAVMYGVGYAFGSYTKNLNPLKIVGLVIVGLLIYSALKNAISTFAWMFIFGVATHHTSLLWRAGRWARSIGDFIFATRYRKAFEDIRRREAELADLERKLREQYRAQSKNHNESGTQQQWREQAKARKTGSSGTTGSTGGGGYSTSSNSARDEYLRTMGLNPQSQYSADDLKRAYRKRARETHPDLGGSTSDFQRVAGAYEWLLRHQGG